MRRSLLLLCVLFGGLTGCKSANQAPAQPSLLDAIPDGALAAVVLRANLFHLVRQQLDDDPATKKELSDYLVKREGIDLSAVNALVAFTTAPDARDGAVLLQMPPSGTPRWDKAGEVEGTAIYHLVDKIVAAVVPSGLVIGTEAGVRSAVLVALKKQPSLKKGSPLEALLDIDPSTSFAVGVSVNAASDPKLQPVAALYGLSALTAGYSPSKVFLWASGSEGGLKAARDAAKGFLDLGLEKVKEEKTKALAGDNTLAGAAAITSYSTYARLAPKVTPRLEGGRLVVDYTMPKNDDGAMTMMTTVAIVGVLAAVAIPAFMKYIRRSKTMEATMNLRRLYDAEVTYWEEKHTFSPSADWTPSAPCCRQPGGKCPADPSHLAGSPWNELGFTFDEPHFYQYRIQTTKTGFTVEARGDLDCDGKFSLFRRTGTLEPGGLISGGAGLYSQDDIE